jgi:hypothetical protein
LVEDRIVEGRLLSMPAAHPRALIKHVAGWAPWTRASWTRASCPFAPASRGRPGSRYPLLLAQHRRQGLSQAVDLGLQHGDLSLGHRLRGFPGFRHPQLSLTFGLGELLLQPLNLAVGLQERLLQRLDVGTPPSDAMGHGQSRRDRILSIVAKEAGLDQIRHGELLQTPQGLCGACRGQVPRSVPVLLPSRGRARLCTPIVPSRRTRAARSGACVEPLFCEPPGLVWPLVPKSRLAPISWLAPIPAFPHAADQASRRGAVVSHEPGLAASGIEGAPVTQLERVQAQARSPSLLSSPTGCLCHALCDRLQEVL